MRRMIGGRNMINQFYKLPFEKYRLLENTKGSRIYSDLSMTELFDLAERHERGLFIHKVEKDKYKVPYMYFYISRNEVKIPYLHYDKNCVIEDTSEGKVGDLLTTYQGNTFPIVGKFLRNYILRYIVQSPSGSILACSGYRSIRPLYESELLSLKNDFRNKLMEGFES